MQDALHHKEWILLIREYIYVYIIVNSCDSSFRVISSGIKCKPVLSSRHWSVYKIIIIRTCLHIDMLYQPDIPRGHHQQ